MSNARKLADNLPTEGHFGNRNIVINGNFTVSQRGSYTSSTSLSDGVFTLDRWQYVEDGSPNSSLIHNSDGSVKVTTGASVTGSSRLRQKFEYSLAPRPYDGKTFTVSAKVKSNTANARINVYAGGYLSLTGTTAHSGGGSYETLTATFTTPSTISTEFSLHIGIDGASSANVSITSGQYFEVKEVQMEEGSQHTPFEHEPISTTLAKCQRYYAKIKGPLDAHPCWTYGTVASTQVPLPAQMRVIPSVTFTGTTASNTNNAVTSDNFSMYSASAWKGTNNSGVQYGGTGSSSVQSIRINTYVYSAFVRDGVSAGLYMGANCSMNADAEL